VQRQSIATMTASFPQKIVETLEAAVALSLSP